ncbi:N-acetylmuramoyl-L-alanine amidase [Tunturibacter psychrotolerans]|uniref:N-acetylmuramoyl-L-alanine amidase n=1 Tax=Tunturiibacter psychrotolerans TaxID=3069686 RepID=A0AAU7ZW43_9BACT
MTLPANPIAARLVLALLTSLAAASLSAQQPLPRTVIFLDPAHGGSDSGARLSDNLPEKSLTLSFAARLRTALSSPGFSVIATRDSDPTASFTTDQRAEIANHSHPTACLILHATAGGNGIHIITSDLPPPDGNEADTRRPIPWDTAQSASIPQSVGLANTLGLALLHARLPVLLSRASLRSLDNLTCPAVAIEIAPLTPADGDTTPVSDANYQQQIAQAIATGLTTWRRNLGAPAGVTR